MDAGSEPLQPPALTQNEGHEHQSPPRLQRPPPFRPGSAAARSARRGQPAGRGRRGAAKRSRSPSSPADWNDIAKVLDTATEKLSRAWGVVSHLNGVADTPELRAAYNEALPKVTDFWTRLGSDERLYAKYKAIDSGHAERRTAPGTQERHPQLRPGRRRTHGRGPRPLRRHPGAPGRAQPEVQRERARRHRCLFVLRRRRGTGRRAAGRGPGRPGRGAGGRQGRLQAHAEDAQLPAGHAVRAQQRAARARSTAPTSPAPATWATRSSTTAG